jgi:outer membrane murein-binding lipoprotein Lpp
MASFAEIARMNALVEQVQALEARVVRLEAEVQAQAALIPAPKRRQERAN